MDTKYARLQNFVKESQNEQATSGNDKDATQRSSTRNVLQNNLSRLQSFFNKYSTVINDGTLSSSDDLQGLLQKGDNDPILPALVKAFFSSDASL